MLNHLPIPTATTDNYALHASQMSWATGFTGGPVTTVLPHDFDKDPVMLLRMGLFRTTLLSNIGFVVGTEATDLATLHDGRLLFENQLIADLQRRAMNTLQHQMRAPKSRVSFSHLLDQAERYHQLYNVVMAGILSRQHHRLASNIPLNAYHFLVEYYLNTGYRDASSSADIKAAMDIYRELKQFSSVNPNDNLRNYAMHIDLKGTASLFRVPLFLWAIPGESVYSLAKHGMTLEIDAFEIVGPKTQYANVRRSALNTRVKQSSVTFFPVMAPSPFDTYLMQEIDQTLEAVEMSAFFPGFKNGIDKVDFDNGKKVTNDILVPGMMSKRQLDDNRMSFTLSMMETADFVRRATIQNKPVSALGVFAYVKSHRYLVKILESDNLSAPVEVTYRAKTYANRTSPGLTLSQFLDDFKAKPTNAADTRSMSSVLLGPSGAKKTSRIKKTLVNFARVMSEAQGSDHRLVVLISSEEPDGIASIDMGAPTGSIPPQTDRPNDQEFLDALWSLASNRNVTLVRITLKTATPGLVLKIMRGLLHDYNLKELQEELSLMSQRERDIVNAHVLKPSRHNNYVNFASAHLVIDSITPLIYSEGHNTHLEPSNAAQSGGVYWWQRAIELVFHQLQDCAELGSMPMDIMASLNTPKDVEPYSYLLGGTADLTLGYDSDGNPLVTLWRHGGSNLSSQQGYETSFLVRFI